MSRPHEDRERHTTVDHRSGGSPVTFVDGGWVAVGVARAKAERNDACVAAYETLAEKAEHSSGDAGPAVVFASDNGRRVITMAGVRGHDGFRHLAAAWDDHHRSAQHLVISESVSFAFYEVAAGTGTRDIDASSHDTYVYEHVARPIANVSALFASQPDFVGATVFHDENTDSSIILSRFAHATAYDSFRNSRGAQNTLGAAGEVENTGFRMRPRKTNVLTPS